MSSDQPCYTLINIPGDTDPPNEVQIKQDLESNDIKLKIEALKRVITMMLAGNVHMQSNIQVIRPDYCYIFIVKFFIRCVARRFVMPSHDHTIKKMLLVFWEVVPKYNADGKMLQEMILVCDAYRKDLQHPNEFIRGSTLRFLCKLKESELLEPLMPSIRMCLEHRHSYVRRNAVLAIYTIYRNFEFLIPDAPELVANFLDSEQDASCKRNAFIMLIYADQDRALSYLSDCVHQVNTFGDILQLVIVELIYKVCHTNPNERSRFIRCIYALLNSNSAAVRYEAARTLATLSSAPTAIKASASCYIELIIKESDNNIKLIVLDRLVTLKETASHEKVLQELVMDILRVLSSPDYDVRRKTLSLALSLVTSRNIDEMVLVLKKEVVKTASVVEKDEGVKYRQLLVRTLHQCSLKFPDIAGNIIPVLMEFLSDTNELAANDVLVFIREAILKFPELRQLLVTKLLESFSLINVLKIYRSALWILGEFCTSVEDIQILMTLIRQSLGELPIVDDEMKRASGNLEVEDTEMVVQTSGNSTLVTSDGTYATQSAFSTAGVGGVLSKDEKQRPPIRNFMMEGDFFIGACLATSIVKICLRFTELTTNAKKKNAFIAEGMFIMASILHFGKSGIPQKVTRLYDANLYDANQTPITDDDADRISTCIRVLADKCSLTREIFLSECRRSLTMMIDATQVEQDEKPDRVEVKVQADDPIGFMQLLSKNDLENGENMFEITLSQALGVNSSKEIAAESTKLSRVTQLTGFSDPVYAETYVNVNQYDIVLDVLVVNQTSDTLQNLTVELAILGDLKLVEKPQSLTLAPHDFANIKASMKVSSTENGIIFGNIVYDISGACSDRNCVVLNDIHIDIMDYIVPSVCSDTEFRNMWAEFEWENKVSINTNIDSLHEYLDHLIQSTNMKCLTPEKALDGDCGFMAANLYAKSIFGEDALANLSIEKLGAVVTGHIRIRAKSQGMALSLGDKINLSQKKSAKQSKI